MNTRDDIAITDSPSTDYDKFYSFDGNDWLQVDPSATEMKIGKGYIIRGVPTPSGPTPPGLDIATFIGEPNNGLQPITVLGGETSNLIGNPYPSAIDADAFILANAAALTVRFISGHTIPQLLLALLIQELEFGRIREMIMQPTL